MSKVMVVDDSPAMVHLLHALLERAGFKVVGETNPTRAVETAAKHAPDIILLDIAMPEMDGTDVAAKLRADPATAKTPIIYLSGILTSDEAQSYNASVSDITIVSKSLGPKTLCAIIERTLDESTPALQTQSPIAV